MQRLRRGAIFLVALVVDPRPGWPQGVPVGPEFRVNTYTTGLQMRSAVASSAGSFVVVWHSGGQDGQGYGVFGQRHASSGASLGPEFRANSVTTDHQAYPAVAADASGNFVIVWQSNAQDGSSPGIFGQRYASSGLPLGFEFRVNTYTTNSQSFPAVASDASGNFVVVWSSYYQDGSRFGVFGQRYASSGAPLGPEFRVNSITTGQQLFPSIAADASGNFVVVWQSYPPFGGGGHAFGQRYAGSGAPLGPEFSVSSSTTSLQYHPAVASDSSGNFVVVWSAYVGNDYGISGQRYASSGAPLGPEFRINTYTTSFQNHPSVASDLSGNFVVVWTGDSQDGSGRGVFGQRYASSGAPLGLEFQVNTYTTGGQSYPFVASDSAGNFVVVWTSDAQDGASYGVFGQRYGPMVPVDLMRFGVE